MATAVIIGLNFWGIVLVAGIAWIVLGTLGALGKAELVQRPIGHDHASSGRLGRMPACICMPPGPSDLRCAGGVSSEV